MNYSESEILRVLKEQRYWSVSDDQLIKAMKSCSDYDRERIRMEVWRDTYTQALAMVNYNSMNYHEAANNALAAFDKQFPNS